MIVKFWSNFTKRKNSTKQPGGDGVELNGYFRNSDAFSKMSPSLRVDMSEISSVYNVPPYTYAYIPDFGRYYYVSDWSHDQGVWIASLECDVLATYKSYIGASSLYVLRSSAASDGRIVDTKYPTVADPSSYYDSLGNVTVSDAAGNSVTVSDYWNRKYSDGAFIVGLYGANDAGITWYGMTAGAFSDLAERISNYTPGNMDDISEGVAKQLANPMQYIAKCVWLPVLPRIHASAPSPVTNLHFGNYSIVIAGANTLDPVRHMPHIQATLPIRKHPQAASRGIYLNQAPYSSYSIDFYPFGTLSLDSSLMVEDDTLTLDWWTDITSGNTKLTVHSINSLLASVTGSIGVPISLTQATVDIFGTGKGIAQTVAGGIGLIASAATLNVAGAVQSAASVVGGFQSAAAAGNPKISTSGGGNDFLAIGTGRAPRIYADFYNVTAEDNDHLGRPLCEVRQLATIPGFIMCAEGEVEAPATPSELDQIAAYLTGGFFYE